MQNLTVDAATRAQLIAVFAAADGFPASQVHFGFLYEAYVVRTHTYWAAASFDVTPPFTETQAVSLQDGGSIGVFSRVGTSGAWRMSVGTDPWPCPGALPDAVMKVWYLPYMPPAACSASASTPSPAASPDPTRPPKDASVPALCTAAPQEYKVTPTPAQLQRAEAMGRALCAYGVQLGTVWMLENAMSIGGLSTDATGFTYDVQLSYRVGAEYRGIWMTIDRPHPPTGGQPVFSTRSDDATTATARWPDGTVVSVQGMVWSPGPGGAADPLPDPSVLAVIVADPVFDAFPGDVSASATP